MTPKTLTRLPDLVAAGLLAPDAIAPLAPVAARYAVAMTPAMVVAARACDPNDPIARQFVPDIRELMVTPDERADPIGDEAHMPVPGLIHRYPDRVLLKVVHVCPVYCRFCFRREMVGPAGKGAMSAAQIDAALAYVAARPEIFEVILTGGDPFMLSARRAAALGARLAAIRHVRVIRWHTRVPMVDPARVTSTFAKALRAPGKTVVVGVHANHAREFGSEQRMALARLADAGLMLVSQSVLLKGLNDDVKTLAELMCAFLESRVKPYYLHHGDLAPGTGHWRTTVAEGRAIAKALRGRLSGLAQPTYVLDIPGGAGKAPIGPDALGPEGVEDWRGGLHTHKG